ncbi:MAG: hypothetical protein OXI17_03750 [Gammaproteobacteria bacterium]|nr:hypothetical protein [Gammaproteobacteria bacterium]
MSQADQEIMQATIVRYIRANFVPIGKEVTVNVPTGETKKGLFGGEKKVTRKEKQWQQTGYSDSVIDGQKLANDLQSTIGELEDQGYKITQITSVVSGAYNFQYSARGISSNKRVLSDTEKVSGGGSYGYGYGYGYSYTNGLIVVAEKR